MEALDGGHGDLASPKGAPAKAEGWMAWAAELGGQAKTLLFPLKQGVNTRGYEQGLGHVQVLQPDCPRV